MPYKNSKKQLEYQRGWARKNRTTNRRKTRTKLRTIIESAKNVPCMDCGTQYPSYVMDFHHRDPSTKDFTINQSGNRGIAKVKEEIIKCDVICANCHRERTHNHVIEPDGEAVVS